VEGDGRVQRIVKDDGSQVATDFVAAAVGAVVNRELLRGTPIRCEKAILTDERCRTNIENIFAAGDCAAVFDPLFGKHRILDHFDSAVVTGTIAGTNMAAGDASYSTVSTFFSEVFDLNLQGWGESRQVAHRLIRAPSGANEEHDLIEFGIAADGRIAQILAINHRGEDDLLHALVARRVHVLGNEEALKDPAIPLPSLLH
jgi:NADPH-dependent 2,4-dienoyl-CoA reductase/sulfur reductase-like enzyme